MNDKTKRENNFENYKLGLAEMDTCIVSSFDEESTMQMLNKRTFTMFKEIECVEVPTDANYQKECINAFLQNHLNFTGTFYEFSTEFEKDKLQLISSVEKTNKRK
jgi:hypothetical protein